MNTKKKNFLIYFLYAFIVFFIIGFLVWLKNYDVFRQFVLKIENTSFDLRQSIISKHKKPSEDIVIISIDDESYEYIMDKTGSWPISRDAWANLINSVETANPQFIIFDMLFLKPNLNDIEADNNFIASVAQYNNIFLAMNFDNYSSKVRTPYNFGEKYKLDVKEGAILDNDYITFTNVRTLMPKLMEVTNNAGFINVTRDNDGVIRAVAPVYKYQDKYYPNMTFLVALKYLKNDNIAFQKDRIFIDKDHIIPLDSTKRAILNWYSKTEDNDMYKHIPFWKVVDSIINNDYEYLKTNFSNKIVYIGTTATSLSDIKTSPVDANLAGVDFHAVFLNNIIDNNFIKNTPFIVDLIISIILSLIVGYLVLEATSVLKSFIEFVAILFAYLFLTIVAMYSFNLWVSVVLPIISISLTFVFVYSEKYMLKARDYEHTYKLAVTDGLTQLYNHRYFQEQMISNINNYKRYGNKFSLIMIDIDFFKKFNDKYGHQSGDAVLRQMADVVKKNVRSSDIPCRYGGEELSVILPNTEKKDVITTANKICLAVRANKFEVSSGQKVDVTVSIGVSTVGDDGIETQEIIEHADKCLYKAKEQGRNQVVFEV